MSGMNRLLELQGISAEIYWFHHPLELMPLGEPIQSTSIIIKIFQFLHEVIEFNFYNIKKRP